MDGSYSRNTSSIYGINNMIDKIRHIKPLMYIVLWMAWRTSPEYHTYRTWWSVWYEYKNSL